MTEHPITPPEGLVASLRNSAPHGIRDAGATRELWLIHNAFAAGADQELEACCKLLELNDPKARGFLYSARRDVEQWVADNTNWKIEYSKAEDPCDV